MILDKAKKLAEQDKKNKRIEKELQSKREKERALQFRSAKMAFKKMLQDLDGKDGFKIIPTSSDEFRGTGCFWELYHNHKLLGAFGIVWDAREFDLDPDSREPGRVEPYIRYSFYKKGWTYNSIDKEITSEHLTHHPGGPYSFADYFADYLKKYL